MYAEPFIVGILFLLTPLFYQPSCRNEDDAFRIQSYSGTVTSFVKNSISPSSFGVLSDVPTQSVDSSILSPSAFPTTILPTFHEESTTPPQEIATQLVTEQPTQFVPNQNISISHSHYVLKDFGTEPVNQYDYGDIVYPIPFDALYNNQEMRYVNFAKADPRFPSFVNLGFVTEEAFVGSDHIFVTGSSSNHLYSNLNTIYSIMLCEINTSIVFVDYGLDNSTFSMLISEFSSMEEIFKRWKSPAKLYYRKFDFAHFPSWYNILDRDVRGGYSWKVIGYFDVLMESKRIVIWSDGGNLLPSNINRELRRARLFGLYTPYSGDSLQSWLHGKSRRFLGYNRMIRKIMLGKGMCTGGYLFINYNNETVMNNVIFPLLQCAYTRKCIAPIGSSRKNHRQDQAILTALVHSAGIQQSCQARYGTKCRFHQDCHSEERCTHRREQLKKLLSFHSCVC